MGKNSRVILAGRMSIMFVVWAVIIIAAVDSFISPIAPSAPIWVIWTAILEFLSITLVFGWVAVREFFRMLGKAPKKLRSNDLNEWVLLITILAAAFATGGIFQAISTIGSRTVSVSSCISPPNANVTSPNCVQTQTITHAEGANLYFSQLGLDVIAVAIAEVLAFGTSYVALVLKTLSAPEQ